MKKAIPTKQTSANITAILGLLAETPERLKRLGAALSSEELHAPLAVGERSVTEELAHLINCEARSSEAIYLALLAEEPYVPDIHPERQRGKLLHLEQFQFPELLSYFNFRRALLLRVLNSLKEEQWARVVREEGKQRKESVYWLARAIAMHELEHLTAFQNRLPALHF
jgi:hypothetical protein